MFLQARKINIYGVNNCVVEPFWLMSDKSQLLGKTIAMVLRHTSMEDKLSSSQSNANSVARKYWHVGFSCKKVQHLIDIIVVVAKNPAENPAEMLQKNTKRTRFAFYIV